MYILGISAFYHDSAAALLREGEIIAAAQEERYSRVKHDARFPAQAIKAVLAQAGIGLEQVEHIVFFEKPLLKFERLLETYLAFAPRGFASFAKAMPLWLKEKLFQKQLLLTELGKLAEPGWKPPQPLKFSEHHFSHAASAFYPSPFERALVLTLDGVGEWASTTAAIGAGSDLKIFKEISFPHSLGLLYSTFTWYCGFKVNSGEYKLMGLAPYGVPRYAGLIREHLIDLKADGSYRLNLDYFDYCTGLRMGNARFERLFGGPAREAEAPIEQRHMDLAASIQQVTEEVVLRLATQLQRETGEKNLCLAGGVALNCVANGRLARAGLFDRIWIQPAAGDAGGALGAALAVWHGTLGQPRPPLNAQADRMHGALLGAQFEEAEIEAVLQSAGAVYQRLDEAELLDRCARDLAEELAFGWFHGRMEFGPRALGSRSILADPRSPRMQSLLNLKVKFREGFRPFAPIVLAERATDWFELNDESPYMLVVAPVHPRHRRKQPKLEGLAQLDQVRSTVPAITHVDFSARVQTVDAQRHPRLHALLLAFERQTGVPMLINTSFNVRGEPVVCTTEHALRCFMGTHLDRLVLGNCFLRKEDQPEALKREYAHLLPAD